MVICLEQGADLHMAQLMPLPLTVSCFSKIQLGFTFLVPAHPVVQDKGPLKGAAAIQRLAAITAATILFSATKTANCQHFLQIFNLQLADQHDYKTKI